MERRWLRYTAPGMLVVCFLMLVWATQQVVIPKYLGTVTEGNFTEEYYRDPTSHDLLVMGNCESYENISTMKLWKDHGITSFIRGNSNQLVSQSYYLLMDALERETPKVVLFNVQAMTVEAQDTEEYNRMVFDGMRWGRNKLAAIKASAMESESLLEYILPVLRYHSRWGELETDDFRYAFREKPLTSFNGYYLRADVRPATEFPRERRKADYSFSGENWYYLDRIRDACHERGIRLVLMKAPSLYPEWNEAYEQQIVEYAGDYGLSYYNFLELAQETGLDMDQDTYDGGLHLNVYGAEKIADYLGPVLAGEMGLADHRGEPETAAWYDARLEAYEEEKTRQAKEFAELGYIRRFTQENTESGF